MSNFLNDPDGNNSSVRLLMFLWSLAIMVVWVVVCVRRDEITDIPVGVGSVLALTLTAKVVQSVFGEKGKSDVQ